MLAPPLIFTRKCVVTIMAAYWPISALLVSEKLVYRFRFLALCCLGCFSNTRFTLPFASRVASAPDLSIFTAGKWHSWPEILANTGTDLEKKQKKNSFCKQWNLFCHLHCCFTTQGQKHPLPLLLLEQLASSVNHTYQKPPPQFYLLQSFLCYAVSTRKIHKSKVHTKHNSITVDILYMARYSSLASELPSMNAIFLGYIYTHLS